MKTFFWIATILGLAPIVGFSLLHVATCIATRIETLQVSSEEDGTTTHVAMSSVQFGSSMSPLIVNTRAWPSICILIGVSICITGLFFLFPKQPIRVSHDGYARFEPLIKRIMASSNQYPSLIVSARNGNEAILLIRNESGIELSVSADSTSQQKIDGLKMVFTKSNVLPSREDVTHDEHFGTDTIHLSFPLDGNSVQLANIVTEVFRDVFGIKENESMEFQVND